MGYKKWTPEEETKLKELWRKNFSIKAICTILGRTNDSVEKHLARMRQAHHKAQVLKEVPMGICVRRMK